MEPGRFREVAAAMWEEIPRDFRAGVEALVVEDRAEPHPEIEDVYTLGECLSDHWPGAYTEEGGDVRSRVFLYHGSFHELARLDPAFDWEEEIWETLLHELLHHREWAAAEGGLEAYDDAVEENFRRHDGRPFDPDFWRWVPADADGVVRIESEIFVEGEERRGEPEAGFSWRDVRYAVPVPEEEGVVFFVNPSNLASGRLWVVVERRRPWWRSLIGAGGAPEVEHLVRRARAVPAVEVTSDRTEAAR